MVLGLRSSIRERSRDSIRELSRDSIRELSKDSIRELSKDSIRRFSRDSRDIGDNSRDGRSRVLKSRADPPSGAGSRTGAPAGTLVSSSTTTRIFCRETRFGTTSRKISEWGWDSLAPTKRQ